MEILNLIKIKALVSALDSMDSVKITDVIEGFGEKEFGKYKKEYLLRIANKLGEVSVEIRKRGLYGKT